MSLLLSPQRLLACYASGIFPMADETGYIHWLTADPRAVIELDGLRVSRSLRSKVRQGVFGMTINRAFEEVIDACADRAEGTWISPAIREAYIKLHQLGFAHSVESRQGGRLAGGLYGVSIGGAFFGESMFSWESDASKVALVHLVQRMNEKGMTLLDVQFVTDHLRHLGAIEIPRQEYERRLAVAISLPCSFLDGQDGSVEKDNGEEKDDNEEAP